MHQVFLLKFFSGLKCPHIKTNFLKENMFFNHYDLVFYFILCFKLAVKHICFLYGVLEVGRKSSKTLFQDLKE